MENIINLFKGANWASLSGSFTPEDLRKIADEIEENFKEFKGDVTDDTDGLHDKLGTVA